MDKTIPFHTAGPRPAAEIVILPLRDSAKHNPALLAQALAGHSPHEAEDMLCQILEGIAEWLDLLQQGLTSGDHAGMGKPARRIALVAGQIGLTNVAVAAGHIARIAASGDRHALAAVLGRLERAFDIAVTEVWDFRDL